VVIKKSSLPAAQSALRELAPKVSDQVPDLAAIKNLRRQIERALRIGYSYEEVSQTLAKYDISLSSSQLESGMAQLKKADKKRSTLKHLKNSEVPALASPPPKSKKSEPLVDQSVASTDAATPRSSKRAY
jgi:hypothetical protein